VQPDLPSTSNETTPRGKSCCLSLFKKVHEGYDDVLFSIQGNVFFSLFQMNHFLQAVMHQCHRRQLTHVSLVGYVISKVFCNENEGRKQSAILFSNCEQSVIITLNY
jgi:hypothetical protein